ncbi:DUF4349 domain-containing protein [Zavarzinella formosa]|uniref:DUF4349 domain-containing protein n=1 Tax=Zavarzinella formosa TaxID=360055 RepID=UPI000365B8A9|nr:DUF4349 domain-containing protein [Zavarzinella formosa]
MSRISFCSLLSVAVLAAIGCDDKKPARMSSPESDQLALAGRQAPADGRQKKPEAVNLADPDVERKVILNVKMEITVENVEEAGQKITEIVKVSKGYVIKSDESVAAGARRQAVWTIRVPAKSIGEVADSLKQLGEVTRRNMDSNDVTDEFYDTEARLKHWKGEEETLLKLLKEKAQSPEDILKFRAQINPIRENIDRMEARMKTIRTLTEMSTIDLTIKDRDVLTPPNTSSKPTTSVGRTFAASVETLQDFGHDVLIFCVGLAPWLPLIAVALLLLRWITRRLNRPKPARLPPPLTHKPATTEV